MKRVIPFSSQLCFIDSMVLISSCTMAVYLGCNLSSFADSVDADDDGMSDVWQRAFQLPSGAGQDDLDGDGENNLAESKAGTNPRDSLSNSRLGVNQDVVEPLSLRWLGVGRKRYQVQRSLDSESWTDIELSVTGRGVRVSQEPSMDNPVSYYRVRQLPDEDADRDLLLDWEERLLGTDPDRIDSDADGISDGEEVFVEGTDPTVGLAGPYVMMMSDPWIPNLAHATLAAGTVLESQADGDWSNPDTWGGRSPADQHVVVVKHAVRFDVDAEVRDIAVYPRGFLSFRTDADTRMLVETLEVLPGGTLHIGTEAEPIEEHVSVEIVFKDRPFDLSRDPAQYGHGLVVFGTLRIYGASKNCTWTRLAKEVFEGDTALQLEEAVQGWKAGSTIVLPDSRQVPPTFVKQFNKGNPGSFGLHWEELTIQEVVDGGTRVLLETPVSHDHPGVRNANGEVELLPHVALLGRNIVLRSENPDGTRGHTLFGKRADCKVHYARFKDLGRTKNALVHNTVLDETGLATQIGTNQTARYPIHTHHLAGPVNPANSGYQFELVGNTVDGFQKWGYTIHRSSFGLIKDNVAYDGQGSGFVTEDGSEIGNLFEQNIAIRMWGTFSDGKVHPSQSDSGDFGFGGTGFWNRRTGNILRGNVAASCSYGGYVLTYYYGKDRPTPIFRGSIAMMGDQGQDHDLGPIGAMEDNEAYGISGWGMYMAWHQGFQIHDMDQAFPMSDTRFWHFHVVGVEQYHTRNIKMDTLTLLGDKNAFWHEGERSPPIGLDMTGYENEEFELTNSRIEHMLVGIQVPNADASHRLAGGIPTFIRDCDLKNYMNVFVMNAHHEAEGKQLEIHNTLMSTLDDVPLQERNGFSTKRYNIYWDYDVDPGNLHVAPLMYNEVMVFDHNGIAGDTFRVYMRETAPDHIVPPSQNRLHAATEPNLTNQELWVREGRSIGGSPAPCLDITSHPDIYGITCPLTADDLDTTPPPQPQNLAARAISSSEIELTWDPVEDDRLFVGYIVNRSSDHVGKTGTNRFVVRGLRSSRSYSAYHVIAYDAAYNQSEPSIWASATTLEDAVPPEVILVAAQSNLKEVKVVYSEPVSDGVKTKSNYQIDGGVEVNKVTVPFDQSDVACLGLTADLTVGATYTLIVNNVLDRPNAENSMTPDSSITFTVPDMPPVDAPSDIVGVATSSTSIMLSWRDNASGETGYLVERENQGAFTLIGVLGPNTTTFTDSGLLNASYTYRVKAAHPAENSDTSEEVTILLGGGDST